MFWKARCKKAAQFLDSYNRKNRQHEEENRQYDVKGVVETVAKILHIPVSFSITPQETSCCVLDLITEFEYRQSEEVLFPSWLNQSREERLAFLEQDYGKFYEAVYKFDSDEQRCRLQMVAGLCIFRFDLRKSYDILRFFEALVNYLRCADSVKKEEMQLFLEKSLSAVWGIYLEKQGIFHQKNFKNIIGFAKNACHLVMTDPNHTYENDSSVDDFIHMLTPMPQKPQTEGKEKLNKK